MVKRDVKKDGKPVVEVTLQGWKVRDDHLKGLTALKHVATLRLQQTKLTDAGLKELAALKGLTSLYLAGRE